MKLLRHYPSSFLYITAGAVYYLHQCAWGKPAKQVTVTNVAITGKKTVFDEKKVDSVTPLEKKKNVFVPPPMVKKTLRMDEVEYLSATSFKRDLSICRTSLAFQAVPINNLHLPITTIRSTSTQSYYGCTRLLHQLILCYLLAPLSFGFARSIGSSFLPVIAT